MCVFLVRICVFYGLHGVCACELCDTPLMGHWVSGQVPVYGSCNSFLCSEA